MLRKKNDVETRPLQPDREQTGSFTPAAPAKNGEVAVIGRSIVIKGEVTGRENLIIEGSIEGRVVLEDQHVTVGPTGVVQAEVNAREVTIEGKVIGNVQAGERVVITKEGSLTGDIQAARLSVEDGAYLKGTVALNPREKEKTIPLARPIGTGMVKDKKEEAANT